MFPLFPVLFEGLLNPPQAALAEVTGWAKAATTNHVIRLGRRLKQQLYLFKPEQEQEIKSDIRKKILDEEPKGTIDVFPFGRIEFNILSRRQTDMDIELNFYEQETNKKLFMGVRQMYSVSDGIFFTVRDIWKLIREHLMHGRYFEHGIKDFAKVLESNMVELENIYNPNVTGLVKQFEIEPMDWASTRYSARNKQLLGQPIPFVAKVSLEENNDTNTQGRFKRNRFYDKDYTYTTPQREAGDMPTVFAFVSSTAKLVNYLVSPNGIQVLMNTIENTTRHEMSHLVQLLMGDLSKYGGPPLKAKNRYVDDQFALNHAARSHEFQPNLNTFVHAFNQGIKQFGISDEETKTLLAKWFIGNGPDPKFPLELVVKIAQNKLFKNEAEKFRDLRWQENNVYRETVKRFWKEVM